jgi:hypothetical protein
MVLGRELDGDGALADERDRRQVGTDAMARDAAGGVGGAGRTRTALLVSMSRSPAGGRAQWRSAAEDSSPCEPCTRFIASARPPARRRPRNSRQAALKSAECRLLLSGQEIALARQQIRTAWSTHPATATR